MAIRINKVMGKDEGGKLSYKLLSRVLREVAIDLTATKVNSMEERRVRWMRYRNLKMWLDN